MSIFIMVENDSYHDKDFSHVFSEFFSIQRLLSISVDP